MHWADSIAKALSHRGDKHVIASGITPSGEFHIGHLREIVTSDIIKRACLALESVSYTHLTLPTIYSV